jgi:small subunit ribosomal protein S2
MAKKETIAEKIKEEVKELATEIEKVEKKAEKKIKNAVKKVEEEVEDVAENIAKKVEEEVSEIMDKNKVEELEVVKEKAPKKSAKSDLLARAKQLEAGVKEEKEVDLKKKLKPEGEEKETLVPMDDYLKSSIYLGTKVITPDMRKYVYRRRADGLAVFNTALLDDKIREGAEYLAKFAPQDIIIVCKREAGWKAAKKLAETLGIKVFTKKYPSGILTNTILEGFFETDLVFIADPWLDKNAMADANRIKIPVLAICDTNNYTQGVSHVIPGNNKSGKSLGMIYFLLTKLYAEKRKMDVKIPPIQEFIDDWDNLQAPQ